MRYKYYETPIHGYVEVTVKELYELGLIERISPDSFLSKDMTIAYLEEKEDADIFLEALWNCGIEFELENWVTGDERRLGWIDYNLNHR